MTQNLNHSIVTLFCDGQLLGVGFLVSQYQILTCTHVLKEGHDRYEVRFSLVASRIPYFASVVRQLTIEEGDITGLELDKVPVEGFPVALSLQTSLWRHSFRAFGYPTAQDEGIWTEGIMLGNQNNGWIQIQGIDDFGYFVQPGFSGGPVYDLQLKAVVGMIVASDKNTERRIAYMIPTEKLLKAWPELQVKLDLETAYQLELQAPGLLRYTLDQLAPRFHRFLTQIGVLPKPSQFDLIDTYLEQFCYKMQELNIAYIPLRAKYNPTVHPKENPLSDQGKATKNFRNNIRSLIDLSNGGDYATARIIEVSRKSRVVRNITRKLVHAKEPIVLLGDPGTGKSMTLREVGMQIAQKERQKVFPKIIIYLRLGSFTTNGQVHTISRWALASALSQWRRF